MNTSCTGKTVFSWVFPFLLVFSVTGPGQAGQPLGESRSRREIMLETRRVEGVAALPRLVEALEDESALVRRTAAHLLVSLGEPALPGIEKALGNRDFQVRRIILEGLSAMGLFGRYRQVFLDDGHPDIRRDAERLARVADFFLPASGWHFRLDPGDTGRDGGWFEPGHDETAWRDDARILVSWNDFLEERYIGVAWYRRRVLLPEISRWDEAWLEFGAVDESAWVWVNGVFAGSHDIGPSGWSKPFQLDVSSLIRPGEKNLFAFRVMNTAGEGGVYQPVRLNVPFIEVRED